MSVLYDLDKINTDKGYLLGTTNQLFLNLSKLKADIVVDLDKQTFICIDKLLINHTAHEKKLFKFTTKLSSQG